MQRINVTLILKGMCWSPVYINVSMFAQIFCDPASFTEEVSIGFYESSRIAFPNMSKLASFAAEVWSLQSARHFTEERGGVSRAH